MESNQIAYYKTPIGIAKIEGNTQGITSITVMDTDQQPSQNIPSCLQACVQQLQEYFEGNRKQFTVTLNPSGTEFQKKVWQALQTVSYGKTSTYLKQSKAMGNVKAIRAVAAANGKNPIWIIIPCHRIIGTDGSLTGYAGGIWRKKWLLSHENPSHQQSLF